jgi:hypothetical protein
MSKPKPTFCLDSVHALENARLQLCYADGKSFIVDLTEWINSSNFLQPLRDPVLFASVKLSAWGRAVEFGEGEIDLAGDNLRNLAIEQAGGIGHERIWTWMHDNHLTLDQAAKELEISRRILIYYRNGEQPIPKRIWLACVGWETLKKKAA